MKALHALIAERFNKEEIEAIAYTLGIELGRQKKSAMALELFESARQRLLLDELFVQIKQRRTSLDLIPYLYELIAAAFDEKAIIELCRNLDLDSAGLGLDAQGLLGWDFDEFLKRKKSWEIQEHMRESGEFDRLIYEIQNFQPDLNLEVFVHAYESASAMEEGAREYEDEESAPPVELDLEGTPVGELDLAGEGLFAAGRDILPTISGPAPADPTAAMKPVAFRLDLAVPERVQLNRSFEVAVSVRQPDSSVLEKAELTHVESGQVQIFWPESDAYVRLRVEISAPDCEVHDPDNYPFRLFPGQDSPVFYFQLTPHVTGSIGIIATLYQETDTLGSARVHTEADETVAGEVGVKIVSHNVGESGPGVGRPSIKYEDFDIHIGERDTGGKYPVMLLGSPRGRIIDKPILQDIPVDDPTFMAPIQYLSGLVARPDDVKELGHQLKDLLFPGDIWDRFERSRDETTAADGLRIRLQIHEKAIELSRLPWEYAYEKKNNAFFSMDRTTPIVRYIEKDFRVRSLATPKPRLLVVLASPEDDDLPPLDQAAEVALIKKALDQIPDLEWDLMTGKDTYDRLQKILLNQYDILHYIGHGLQTDSDVGALAFEDEKGRLHEVDHESISILLRHTGIKMVVLTACETAVPGEGDIFKGVAQSLVQADIPAVIAMQFIVEYDVAREFTYKFYDYLAAGQPLDKALTEARINIQARDKISWGIPVLFMQAPDGIIWSPTEAEPAGEEDSRAAGVSSPTVLHKHYYSGVETVNIGDEIVFGNKEEVHGDKAGEDVISGNITISGVSGGSAVSVTGNATVINQGEVSRDDFDKLLKTILTEFKTIEETLKARDAREVAQDLKGVQEETSASKPDGAWIVRKLGNVAEIVAAAGATATAAGQLIPHVQQAMEMAKALFGG